MADAIEFFRKGGDEPEIFACGKCGAHWAGAIGRDIAEDHCEPGVCRDCGRADLTPHWLRCDGCREAARFEAAPKVKAADWTGPVEWDERFFRDVDELYDYFEGDDQRPEHARACEVRRGASFDPERVIESIQEDTHEEYEVADEAELREFFEAWNAKQTAEWWETTETIVLLEWPAEEPTDA